jgi:hypothetical protein
VEHGIAVILALSIVGVACLALAGAAAMTDRVQ